MIKSSYIVVASIFLAGIMFLTGAADTHNPTNDTISLDNNLSSDNINNIKDTPTSAMVTALTGNWYELSQIDLSSVDAATAEMIIQRGVQPIRDSNAAPRYITAMFFLPDYDEDEYKKTDEYDTKPFAERITAESQELIINGISNWQSGEQTFRSALTCSYCEWHRNNDAGFNELLPDLGKMRAVAKWHIRLAENYIANGKPWDALRCYREVLAMGRDVGKGAYLIRTLVGIAIESLAYIRLNEAIPTLIDQGIEPERILRIISRRYRQFADPVTAFAGERIAFATPSMGLKTLNYQNTDAFWDNVASMWYMFLNEGEYGDITGPKAKQQAIDTGFITAEQADDPRELTRLVLEEVEYFNSVLDRVVLAVGLNAPEWSTAIDKIESEFVNQQPKRLSQYMLPSLKRASEAMRKSQRFRRATNLLLLAITYRDKHNGNWPESIKQLNEWRPEYSTSDPVSGTWFQMECNEKTVSISWPEDDPDRDKSYRVTLIK